MNAKRDLKYCYLDQDGFDFLTHSDYEKRRKYGGSDVVLLSDINFCK